ncbi:MAG: hypothetical protein JO271_13480, partial [Verrucomicrobia bacterium]|nr:hypothetical protein [Verrucomicrobiota bacterium]
QVLVRPFASALDHLTDRQELKGIIKLRKTFVVFPRTVSELETIQHSVLSSWPGYTMKADTLDLCTDLQTAEPAETLVEGSNLVFCDHPVCATNGNKDFLNGNKNALKLSAITPSPDPS